jgi:hypothetical protein
MYRMRKNVCGFQSAIVLKNQMSISSEMSGVVSGATEDVCMELQKRKEG